MKKNVDRREEPMTLAELKAMEPIEQEGVD